MSAWIVTENHINTMVEWGLRLDLIDPDEATETGRTLWAENLASVAYRYPNDTDGTRPGPNDFRDDHVNSYEYAPASPIEDDGMGRSFDPTNPRHAVTQIECYQYQSCEHPEWGDSSARRYTQDVMRELGRNPGMPRSDGDDIPWGV